MQHLFGYLCFWLYFPTCIHPPTPTPAFTPFKYQPWYPGLLGIFWTSPPGHRSSHPGALWRASPGEPVGVIYLLPTPQECTVLSGPPGFLRRESARPSMLLVPCGDTFCLTVKGVEVGGSCLLSHPSSPRTPSQRPGCPEVGGHSSVPALSTPSPFFLPQALLECDRSHGQGMSQQQEYTLQPARLPSAPSSV